MKIPLWDDGDFSVWVNMLAILVISIFDVALVFLAHLGGVS